MHLCRLTTQSSVWDENVDKQQRPLSQVDVDCTMLDVEVTCYLMYLDDMFCVKGGCVSTIAPKCWEAWGKFRKRLPILTTRHLSPRVCGKVYTACVHPVMLHSICSSKRWWLNSLRPSDTIWRHRSGSTLAQVMACCLTAPSHYLNQCWLIIS